MVPQAGRASPGRRAVVQPVIAGLDERERQVPVARHRRSSVRHALRARLVTVDGGGELGALEVFGKLVHAFTNGVPLFGDLVLAQRGGVLADAVLVTDAGQPQQRVAGPASPAKAAAPGAGD